MNDSKQALNTLSELGRAGRQILFIPGNTDSRDLATYRGENITCIDGRQIEYEGYAFLGLGGAPLSPFNTPYQWSEQEASERLVKAHKEDAERLIIISHAPPKDTRLDKIWSGAHVGSQALREFIEAVHPLLVICGHIHEAKGCERIGDTAVVNPGPAYAGFYSILELDSQVSVVV